MNTEVAESVAPATGEVRKKEITDLSSMLLPVEGQSLLLPGVAVAEIVMFIAPEHDDTDMPAWFLGTITWRKQRVPLIAYETLMRGEPPSVSDHCRIAVMNNTGLSEQLHFYAMLLQATPKLLRLKGGDVKINEAASLSLGEKMHVTVMGEDAVIPDTQHMERAIIRQLQLW